MSEPLNPGSSELMVPAEQVAAALAAVKAAATSPGVRDTFIEGCLADQIMAADSLGEALALWDFEVELGDDGGVVGVFFEGNSDSDAYEVLFRALAPYASGYLTFKDDFWTMWRYRFEGGRVYRDEGEVVYGRSATPCPYLSPDTRAA